MLVKISSTQFAQDIGLLRSILCVDLQPLLGVQSEQSNTMVSMVYYVPSG